MKIILMRHGEPVLAPTAWIAPFEMEQWIKDYNFSEVSTDIVPSSSLEIAHSVACIVASTAPRALSSVRALGHTPIIIDSLFCEAQLPYARCRFPRLSPFVWAAFFRVLWFLGYAQGCDSIQATRIRAKAATLKLVTLAEQGTVLLMGHGIMNRLIGQELVALGWAGTTKSKYWSTSIYEFPT